MKKLFTPAQLGTLELSNHMVMAPLTRSRAIHNMPNALMANYYRQRSTAGLIITEGTSPSPNGLGYSRIPGIFSHHQIERWKEVTEAIHEQGGHIFMQLMHTGRVGHPGNLPPGAEVVAPSAVPLKTTKMWTDEGGLQDPPVPRAMTTADIQTAIAEYIQAAKNAILAGTDGIEVHGANGYLVEQFLNPNTNVRTDEYGGSVENRARFLLEVVAGAVAAIGKEKVGIRLSPYGISNEMPVYDEATATYDHVSKELNKIGIAYIHLVDHSSMSGQVVPVEVTDKIRGNFKGTLILSGNYDADRAESALQNGSADLIAFGKKFLANPDLVHRLKDNLPLNPLRPELFYTSGAEGYTDYPVAVAEVAL